MRVHLPHLRAQRSIFLGGILAPVLNEVERVVAISGAALAYSLDPTDADAVGVCEASVEGSVWE